MSLKDYYQLVKADKSRTGTVVKKVFLESLCGPSVRDGNLLSLLASYIGARRNTLFNCSHNRVKMESDQELLPVMQRLARKPISGDHKISMEWELTLSSWFESDHISEPVKGHHNIFRVMNRVLSDDFFLHFTSGKDKIRRWGQTQGPCISEI